MLRLLISALLSCGGAWAGQPTVKADHSLKSRSGASSRVILVEFKPNADRAAVEARAGGAERRALRAPGWYVVELPTGATVSDALRSYWKEPDVVAAQPDYIIRKAGVLPNDPLFNSQYGLAKISAPAAWTLQNGTSHKVTIAMLDTGIDESHPDLASKIDTQDMATFCPDPSDCSTNCTPCTPPNNCSSSVQDVDGHGTETSGVAAALTDNGVGVAGTSWGATLLPIKIFDNNEPEPCADSVSLSDALNYVAGLAQTPGSNTGPLVANMSIGEQDTSCQNSTDVVHVAAQSALNAGVVLVAAAGNFEPGDTFTGVQCPGSTPGVIAAGATDENDNIASFSARGPGLGVVAPGVDIESTQLGGGYGEDSGTSFASPYTAGLAALLLSAQPGASVSQVADWIYGGADTLGLSSDLQGHGRIDAFRALRLAVDGTLAGYAGDAKVIAFPNPFHPAQGTVTFSVPDSLQASGLQIRIYTESGLLVRTLQSGSWDGRNDAGQTVASGVYVFYLSTDKGNAKGRVAVLR